MGTVSGRRFSFFKGRVALYALLMAMDVRRGDEVIIPGFTCVVVPNAVKYLGATPVYADIDPRTCNVDPACLEAAITGRTKAVIAQHTFGIPADMERIMRIARSHDLFVIEDACHAIGSRYKGTETGAFGDAAFYSSQWSKPVTTGLGGWATVNNGPLAAAMEKIYTQFASPSRQEELMIRLQYLAYSGLSSPSLFWTVRDAYRWLSRAGITIGSSSADELECIMPAGFAKRMSGWQQDCLERQLLLADQGMAHRRMISEFYGHALAKKGVRTAEPPHDSEPVYLRYPVFVEDKHGVLERARRQRVELGDWFLSPVHPNLTGWDKVDYVQGTCQNAEKVCGEIINLPTHRGITLKEARKAVDLVCAA